MYQANNDALILNFYLLKFLLKNFVHVAMYSNNIYFILT